MDKHTIDGYKQDKEMDGLMCTMSGRGRLWDPEQVHCCT